MSASPSPPPAADAALLLDAAGVAALLGVSVRHVRRMADAGEFPRPVAVGTKLKRWPRTAVLAWVEEQSRARR